MGRIDVENLFDTNEERMKYIELKTLITFLESNDMNEALSKLINEFTDLELALAMFLIGKLHALFTTDPLEQVHLISCFETIYKYYKKYGFDYVLKELMKV